MQTASHIADKMSGKVPTSTRVQPNVDETRTMKTLQWFGKHDMRYEDAPRPLVTDNTDVVLKITATTICGSDLHIYNGTMMDMHKGDIIGHEFMGIVEDVGSEVKKIKKGDRVVVAFDIACGNCAYCKRQEYTACDTTNNSGLMENMFGHRTAALYGYSHLTGGVPGGQAEYVRVAFADVNCLVVPQEFSDEQALYLSDVVPTALHGTELVDLKEGDTVAIWGLGPIGLIAARWCQIKKASRVIGIECVPERIAIARKMGIEIINFKEEKVVDKLFKLVPQGVDCAIECAGYEYATSILHKVEMAIGLETDTSDIFAEMFTCVRKFGRVGVIGVYNGYANHFPVGQMMEKDLIIKNGQSPTQKYWDYCVQKIKSGEMDPTMIISHRMKLSDGPELYKKFNNKEEGVIKVFLRPN